MTAGKVLRYAGSTLVILGATYGGMEIGDIFAQEASYYIPVSTHLQPHLSLCLGAGFGMLGHKLGELFIHGPDLSDFEKQSIAALNAFATGERNISPEKSIDAIARNVVRIHTDRGSGSGLQITGDGYAVTARHVIGDYADKKRKTGFEQFGNIYVKKGWFSYPVRPEEVWYDDKEDVALIKAEMPGPPKPLEALVNTGEVKEGTRVKVISNSTGEQVTYTGNVAEVSDSEVYIPGTLPEGTSGSPWVNRDTGEIIGIHERRGPPPKKYARMRAVGVNIIHALDLIKQVVDEKSAALYR